MSLYDVTGVTESTLITLRQMPDEIAAVALDGRLRALEIQWKRSFIERGLILLEVQQRMLWKELINPNTGERYTSFERWVVTAAPQSRSDAFAAKAAVEQLRDVPRHHLEAIPRCNIKHLKKLSTAVRRETSVLEAASNLSELEFVRKINREYPEQHLETPGCSVVDQAVRLAMELESLDSREDVITFWAIAYLDAHQEAETKQ